MVKNHAHSPETLPPEGYAPLCQSQARVENPLYRCPVANCHQIWHRHSLDEAIPHCPIHDLVLVRASVGDTF